MSPALLTPVPRRRGHRRRRAAAIVVALLATLVVATPGPVAAAPQECAEPTMETDVELEHVPWAVADLNAAAATFEALGLTLKPGRAHDNGLRNVHAKFRDGREIELITVDGAGDRPPSEPGDRRGDELSSWYLDHLSRGDGPAFLALHAGPVRDAAASLDAPDGRLAGGTLSFPPGHRWRHLFFGQLNRSPTDLPEHFEHPLGARTLHAVWIATDDASPELDLLARFDAGPCEPGVEIAGLGTARVVPLRESAVYLLPGSAQRVPGRRIVGMTVLVESLDVARARLSGLPGLAAREVRIAGRAGLLLDLHGAFLELRQADR